MITGGSWLQSSRKEKKRLSLLEGLFFIGKNKGSVKIVESVGMWGTCFI